MRITDYLVQDHRRLRAELARATEGESFDADAFERFRAGLLRHIGIEEKILLPAARSARAGARLERAFDLRLDHAALTSLLVPTPDRALCAEIAGLLDVHDAKEEGADGVYAECERLFEAARSIELGERAAELGPPKTAPHFDGHGTVRTAGEALAAARRIKPPRDAE